jgi:hypothetical protein
MSDPAKIHRWVCEFNWDDNLAPIWELVQSAETDFATALLIYWRLEGPWLVRNGRNSEVSRLHDLVESRLLSGVYTKSSLRYDPVADNSLSAIQVAKLKRSAFPVELLEPEYNAE